MYEKFFPTVPFFPRFSSIDLQRTKAAIQKALFNCYNTVDQVISQKSPISWNVLYYPLMIVENELQRIWSPIVHLNAVEHNHLELRKIYEDSLLSIVEYRNWINQHDGLYKSYQSLYKSDSYQKCNIIQKKTLNNILHNFKLSGVLLSSKKKCFKNIVTRLSQLSINYINNVFDATCSWSKLIIDEQVLSGIPFHLLELARLKAIECKKNGWLFTLQYSSYSAIILYCDTAELREELYWAFNTRASDQGPDAGKWDNTAIMDEILALRYESARMLGFSSYLEKSLETKMVRNSKQIFNFLTNLYTHMHHNEEKELLEIQIFAKKYYSCNYLNPWDVEYYREKRKQYLFSIKNEELCLYFSANTVLDGMFLLAHRIYNITIKQRYNVNTWHSDVRFFDIYDQTDEWRGGFYLDLYLRQGKCEGAWMDEFVSLMYRDEAPHQKPIAYLVCNFGLLKNEEELCLLTHNDVVILFHEFGHVLHHIMTQIDIPEVSGINGVFQDVIELPSQFMEKFCWEPDVLQLISAHCITKEPLSVNIINNLLQTRIYQASSYLLKQVAYGLFDLRLHHEYFPGKSDQVLTIFNEVMKMISVYPTVSWNRFSHSFVHIFSDDYAAGYYSYLWSEMLALNVWKQFQMLGVLNAKVGRLFLKNVLELGLFIDVSQCLMDFCKNDITIEPMFQYYGILTIDENVY